MNALFLPQQKAKYVTPCPVASIRSNQEDQTKMEWKAITRSANFGGGEWLL